jgi:hypothetical protein
MYRNSLQSLIMETGDNPFLIRCGVFMNDCDSRSVRVLRGK